MQMVINTAESDSTYVTHIWFSVFNMISETNISIPLKRTTISRFLGHINCVGRNTNGPGFELDLSLSAWTNYLHVDLLWVVQCPSTAQRYGLNWTCVVCCK